MTTNDVEVWHGDCRELMRRIPAGSIDAIVTDPPYNNSKDNITNSHSNIAKVHEETCSVGNPWGYSLDWIEIAAALNPGHWVVFCNYLMLGDVHTALARHARVSAVFVWRKVNAPQMVRPVPRLDCEFIVWARRPDIDCGRMGEFKSLVLDVPMPQAGCMRGERVLRPGSAAAFHPCQKPLAVVLPFVERLFDGPGRTILDPFAGTGTTLVACLKAGRRGIGIELDPRYIPVIDRRVAAARTPLFDSIG